MKVVETQDLTSLQSTHQFVSLDFHIKTSMVYHRHNRRDEDDYSMHR